MFPLTPPLSDKGESDTSSIYSDDEGGTLIFPPVSLAPTTILPVDANSPDKHVPRDSRLIRLTGNHPFNSEAPLTDLFEAGIVVNRAVLMVGFLTPNELFYVRNHGAVPQVQDEEILVWEVLIEG